MGNAAYRERHKAQGLCCKCPNPVAPYHTRCSVCIAKHQARATMRQYRAMQSRRDIEGGRCTSCSRPLDPESDSGYKSCITCRELQRWKG